MSSLMQEAKTEAFFDLLAGEDLSDAATELGIDVPSAEDLNASLMVAVRPALRAVLLRVFNKNKPLPVGRWVREREFTDVKHGVRVDFPAGEKLTPDQVENLFSTAFTTLRRTKDSAQTIVWEGNVGSALKSKVKFHLKSPYLEGNVNGSKFEVTLDRGGKGFMFRLAAATLDRAKVKGASELAARQEYGAKKKRAENKEKRAGAKEQEQKELATFKQHVIDTEKVNKALQSGDAAEIEKVLGRQPQAAQPRQSDVEFPDELAGFKREKLTGSGVARLGLYSQTVKAKGKGLGAALQLASLGLSRRLAVLGLEVARELPAKPVADGPPGPDTMFTTELRVLVKPSSNLREATDDYEECPVEEALEIDELMELEGHMAWLRVLVEREHTTRPQVIRCVAARIFGSPPKKGAKPSADFVQNPAGEISKSFAICVSRYGDGKLDQKALAREGFDIRKSQFEKALALSKKKTKAEA